MAGAGCRAGRDPDHAGALPGPRSDHRGRLLPPAAGRSDLSRGAGGERRGAPRHFLFPSLGDRPGPAAGAGCAVQVEAAPLQPAGRDGRQAGDADRGARMGTDGRDREPRSGAAEGGKAPVNAPLLAKPVALRVAD
ncbi:hypothetical protein QU38_01520, partial [Staphylococcus aureus]